MIPAETFYQKFPFAGTRKVDQAVAFVWLHGRLTGGEPASYSDIEGHFAAAGLPRPTRSRLVSELKKHRGVHRGKRGGTFSVSRENGDAFDKEYGAVVAQDDVLIDDVAGVGETPYLGSADLQAARHMAELYLVLHCYENSIRRFIESVLSSALGPDWWDNAANAAMKRKYGERKAKEEREKWISPRGGTSPLFYLDWGELLTLIRKYPVEFGVHVPDLSFVELRFGELERVRNVVAHNGLLPSEDDFQRVLLSFRDWCRQIRPQ
ncbi:MAG: Swt1 family HEPN domain-containing protein [Longimicrobiaceae bacterium]